MGRRPCCTKELELNRGAWTAMEDKILAEYIRVNGEGKWRNLPERAGLKRCGKSCRLRWLNYLRPGIKRGSITEEEEDLIIRLHKLLGNRWALIAGRLPGRTDNEIKNYWHTKLSKTLKPKCGSEESASPKSSSSHEQSSDDRPKLAKKQRLSGPQDEDKKSSVVRTKATRFTKPVTVVPRSEDQASHDQFDQRSSSVSTVSDIEPLTDSHQMINLDEDSSQGFVSDFAVDFDMDEDFLSGFFNTDWISELRYAEDLGNGSVSEGKANSEETLVFPSEETLPLSSVLESIVCPSTERDHLENWLQA